MKELTDELYCVSSPNVPLVVSSFFGYQVHKDKLNASWSSLGYDGLPVVNQIAGDQRILNLLRSSQPPSIYDSVSKEIIYHPDRLTMLRRAIVLPNSYELFWAPWLADGSFSYPSAQVRSDWKCWFPFGHHAIVFGDSQCTNNIDPSAFDGTRLLINGAYKFFIKTHRDSDNYWHWTFEWLTRLLVLLDRLRDATNFSEIRFYVIGAELCQFQKDWIYALLGFLPAYEILSSPVLCDNLLWATPVFPAHHDPSTIQRLSRIILRHPRCCREQFLSGSSPTRLYVKRGHARNGRMILNENLLVAELEKLGFVAVSMDGLSIYRQAQLFSVADIVVGPHGSAFVNMIFCRPKTAILEFFGPGYLSCHDYSLALSCELNWNFIEGYSYDANSAFSSNFCVDVDLCVSTVMSLFKSL